MKNGEISSPAAATAAAAASEIIIEQKSEETMTTHQLNKPSNLTETEYSKLTPFMSEFHTYNLSNNTPQCSSLLTQRIKSPTNTVWSVIRQFENPQIYKHFIKSCSVVDENSTLSVGSTRNVLVISGLPAATSTERLDILEDELHVTGFSITGGDHRLRNYRSVTTVHEAEEVGTCVVMESYVVDVPEGNTEEDTRLFADTVVKLNLQKLACLTESMARETF